MNEPLTVLMAVRNGEPYLGSAVESILGQTYRTFRFLIIDDASTDQTRDIVRSYHDPRVELVCLERNIGQTAALNLGLRRATTPWVARMDADDYSAPTRLAEELRALGEHPEIQCVGTGVWEFRDDPRVVDVVKTRPRDHAAIRRAALLGSGMVHGSMVASRAALLGVGAYDERYRYASDRDMFLRLFDKYRAMNLQEPLVGIRRHPQQDSFSLRAAEEYLEISQRLLASGRYLPDEVAIIREGLAFCYLFRARCHRARRAFGQWAADELRGLRVSPQLWVRNLVGTVVWSVVPRRRMTLRVPAAGSGA